MNENLAGKVIVITGASSGFGKGAALQFAQNKAHLVLAARRDELIDDLATDCEKLGGKAIAVTTDVSNPDEVEHLAGVAQSTFGHIDVWINNAGAAAVGIFAEVPLADHIKVIETDLIGTICGSHHALKYFMQKNAGILINVASMIGKVPAPYYASYAAAKHGVVGLDAALRQELRAQKLDNIHVCTVMPMAMDTPFFEHAANHSGREVVPIPPLDDAQKVIDVLVKLATDPKDENPVGMGSASNIVMDGVMPAVSEAMLGSITHKAQMVDAPLAHPKDGSLQAPDGTGSGIKDPKIAKR